MNCTISAPGGANKDCIAYLSEAQAAIITAPSFSWADVAAVDNIENLRVLLQETKQGFIVEFNGTEITNSEPVTETTGYGDNIVTAENSPGLIGYLETNPCDFKEMLSSVKNSTWNVAFFLSDGTIHLVDKLTKLQGFKTQVYIPRNGISGRENQTQQYRMMFNFLKSDEFDSYKIVNVNYTIPEVSEFIALGLQADINTAYNTTTGVIVLDVYTRCVVDDAKSGTLTAEIDKGTKGLTLAATPTDDGNGQYTVTVTAGAGQLAAGEYAIFRLVSKTGDIYEEISNAIKVTG